MGEELRSLECVKLFTERRDEGLELIGGGGGVREEEFFMWAVAQCCLWRFECR